MKKFKLTYFAILLPFLTACQSTEISTQSTIKLPTEFEQVKGTSATDVRQWWRYWNDAQLTALIEKGLSANLDIALAQARLKEALANSDLAEADMGISVGASGSAMGGASDLNTGLGNPKNSHSGGAYGGLSVAWEPDFFGQKRSDADAAQSIALSQQAQLYAAQLLVASQIADNYFRFFAYEQQNIILGKNLETLNELQRYVKSRFNAGQATSYEANEISVQISALKARQATLKAQADSYQRNIAVLTGQAPQGFMIVKTDNPLLKIPASPTGQQPGSVIERRPDLQANRHQVQAYAAKLASAKADLYPRFDINFIGQGGRIELNDDLSHISGLTSVLSAGVQLPIFTNGRIEAQIDAADARLKGAIIQYDKALLTALAEVDTAYQNQTGLVKQTNLLQQSYKQAKRQAADAQTLFKYGEKTLDVAIRAKMAALDYQEKIVQSQLAQAQNLIMLYKALGGGWK